MCMHWANRMDMKRLLLLLWATSGSPAGAAVLHETAPFAYGPADHFSGTERGGVLAAPVFGNGERHQRFGLMRDTLKRALLLPFEILVAALLLVDEVARPVYRPLIRWVARLKVVARLEAAVRPLPRGVILILLAVPFAVAEPLKILGLFWIGTGRITAGVATLVFAYAASFLLVERVYHAGREKLLTIAWFAAVIGFIVQVRDALLARIRATRLWSAAATVARGVRAGVARLLGRDLTVVPSPAARERD